MILTARWSRESHESRPRNLLRLKSREFRDPHASPKLIGFARGLLVWRLIYSAYLVRLLKERPPIAGVSRRDNKFLTTAANHRNRISCARPLVASKWTPSLFPLLSRISFLLLLLVEPSLSPFTLLKTVGHCLPSIHFVPVPFLLSQYHHYRGKRKDCMYLAIYVVRVTR